MLGCGDDSDGEDDELDAAGDELVALGAAAGNELVALGVAAVELLDGSTDTQPVTSRATIAAEVIRLRMPGS